LIEFSVNVFKKKTVEKKFKTLKRDKNLKKTFKNVYRMIYVAISERHTCVLRVACVLRAYRAAT